MTVDRRCWCGDEHATDVNDPYQQFHDEMVGLGHAIIAELRIPELVAWLQRWLDGGRR